jgi:hypothetical protein
LNYLTGSFFVVNIIYFGLNTVFSITNYFNKKDKTLFPDEAKIEIIDEKELEK